MYLIDFTFNFIAFPPRSMDKYWTQPEVYNSHYYGRPSRLEGKRGPDLLFQRYSEEEYNGYGIRKETA